MCQWVYTGGGIRIPASTRKLKSPTKYVVELVYILIIVKL